MDPQKAIDWARHQVANGVIKSQADFDAFASDLDDELSEPRSYGKWWRHDWIRAAIRAEIVC